MYSQLRNKIIGLAIMLLTTSVCMAGNTVEIPNEKFDQNKFRSLLREYIFSSYKDERGVHIESALSALGALSGFALQQGIREELITKQGKPENQVFTIVETKDGQKYFFGSIFDQPLYDTRPRKISVWTLVGGAAQKAGAKTLPDINALAKTNAETVGTDDYGKLSVPKNHQPKDSPQDAIKKHWKLTEKLLKAKGSEPLMWSWEIALVAQDLIILGKEAISPTLAAQIVMEPAISMSKIDPKSVLEEHSSRRADEPQALSAE